MKNKVAMDILAVMLARKNRGDIIAKDYLLSLGMKFEDISNKVSDQEVIFSEQLEKNTDDDNNHVDRTLSDFSFNFFTTSNRLPKTNVLIPKLDPVGTFTANDDLTEAVTPKKLELEPISQLLARLNLSLKQRKSTRKVAVKRLVSKIAKQQTLVTIPVVSTQKTPNRLYIYLDLGKSMYGLRADGFALAQSLVKSLPHSQCRIIVLPEGEQGSWAYLGGKEQRRPLILPEKGDGCLIITGLTHSSKYEWRFFLSSLSKKGIRPLWLSVNSLPVFGHYISWGKQKSNNNWLKNPLDFLSVLLSTCRIITGAMLRELVQHLELAAYYETTFWRQSHVDYQSGSDTGYITNNQNDRCEQLEQLSAEQLNKLSVIIEKHLSAIGNSPLHEHRIHLSLATTKWDHPELDISYSFFKLLGVSLQEGDDYTSNVAQFLSTTVKQYDGLIEQADSQVQQVLALSSSYNYKANPKSAIPTALADKVQQILSQQHGDISTFQLHQLGNKLEVQKEDHKESFITAPFLLAMEHSTCSPLLLYPEMSPEAIRIIPPDETHVIADLTPMILQSSVEQLKITPHNSKTYYWAKSLSVTSTGVVAATDDIKVYWSTAQSKNNEHYGVIVDTLDRAPKFLQEYQPQLDNYGLFINLKVKSITFKLRYIPPGSFIMGSPQDEVGRNNDENPHIVTLTEGLWLSELTVTQEQWQAVMGSNPSVSRGITDSELLPVTNVSWNDCMDFFQKLNDSLSDITLTFPTEAQWEYACRAGTMTSFSFGETLTPELANFYSKKINSERTILPVKTFIPNPWGLYQMHGNVREWCADTYRIYTSQAITDPIGEDNIPHRAVRGGSWYKSDDFCRSASRSRLGRGLANKTIGFRVAINVKEK
jgi:formylglycine-generating enzyme required for sulfatase activity